MKKIYVAFVLILAVFLICLADEKQPSKKPKANESLPSENWKEYESLVELWPQLKKEGIESIRDCYAMSPEYGEDSILDFEENVNTFGYRERAAEVVKWWPTAGRVPREKLPELIEIIDKSIKKADRSHISVGQLFKILIVTGRGNYIFLFPREKRVSDELSEFLRKYCTPSHEFWFALPLKEKTVAIVIFSNRYTQSYSGSVLSWPPIALFGDKKEAEELIGRSFEPKMVFEGREWLVKMIDEYEVAMKDAEEKRWREVNDHPCKGYIVFLTQDEFYWKEIGIDGNPAFGGNITESKQIKKYFDELEITKELLAGAEPSATQLVGEPNKTSQD